ncbi:hypothetical protein CVT24_006687 [Panaeolus cyanescens]|uniref:U2A'/phosphoprotein 32 family A C-terminal domain-containing protein n=1 Tax=Panaeolus cyanescens TaxID=181874 RepID=A0A409YRX7_9AGAR|nr:hypothetical protein CVT24_006687 [Panaeolus cyanescens]
MNSTMDTEDSQTQVKNETIEVAGSNEKSRSHPSARVVLPTAEEVDTDEEGEEEEHAGGDFLADFPDETEELELLHSRIGSLDELRLPRFAPSLRRLCLRQNFISTLDPQTFHQLTKLEDLDLYDNKIKQLGDALDQCKSLKTLDLSFNLLKSVPDRLEFLTSLNTIYFVQNKISKITGFASCTSLRSLELGGNRIRKIEYLDSLVNLEELWLGKNKIVKLENLQNLKKLRILSIQSNRITKLEGLDNLSELSELYLSHNGIERLEGLENNKKLTTLDVGNNFIPAIENISHLTHLEELWVFEWPFLLTFMLKMQQMNGNKIPDLRSLETELGGMKSLATLYLEHNPCQTNDMTGYRRKISIALPQLKQIDATYTRAAVDLKAELSRQEVEFAKAKAAGKSTSSAGGATRPEKKPTVWARQNKGVASRASRDVELEEISKPTLESARAVLERKAKIYEKLRKGKTGGLSDKQYDSLLVDFDSAPSLSRYYEDEDDEDESANVPIAPLEDDPVVEYEDEFGRLRTARRSEVPRDLLRHTEPDEDEELVIRNPVNHFPVYQPSEERLANIAKAEAESFAPLNVHYDASREVRAKGAGFYQFSGDEETRKLQMNQLNAAREETARTREELGAEDVRPGDIEGMRERGTALSNSQSKAIEKRKRDIEERRKMIEAKRRKLGSGTEEETANIHPDKATLPQNRTANVSKASSRLIASEENTTTSQNNPDPFAALETRSFSNLPSEASGKKSAAVDPFASLDIQQAPKSSNTQPLEADRFLAELEREFIGSRTKQNR